MSQENVDLLREMFETYSLGGESPEFFDPEVIWNPVDEVPMEGVDAVRAYLRRWEAEWEDLRTVPEEFIDCGDQVLVTVHFLGRGRQSEIEVDARTYEVYTLRAGRIARMDEFSDRAEALEAVGLLE